MEKKFISIVVIFFTVIAIVFAVNFYINTVLDSKVEIDEELIIDIPHNSSITEIVNIMNQNSIFKPNWIFKYYLKFYSKIYDEYILAGTYRFVDPQTNRDILNAILSGSNQHIIKVTYPEGITVKKFAEITEMKFKIPVQDFLDYCNNDSILKIYDIQANSVEGYLMPATFNFYFKADAKTIINKLLQTHKTIWNKKFEKLAQMKGWSKQRVLTLASIIEAETPVAEERPIISQVYHNRLKKGMLLQADPTIQYILGGKPRLLYRDLKIDNPYNTYRFAGLPPGPINSPSESSISAALQPAKHDFLYFVAKGDGSGRHNFAKNISDHGKFVVQYRKALRK